MGRKTWDSIPARFRPLKGRLNIVISRSLPAATAGPPQYPADPDAEPVGAASLEQALAFLEARPPGELGRVFVIGGGQIYTAALQLPQTRRLLFTRILSEFECDTFFPLPVATEPASGADECAPGWTVRPKAELDKWVGEEVPAGTVEENGTEYEFQMWEKA